jgi:hypothetical protein
MRLSAFVNPPKPKRFRKFGAFIIGEKNPLNPPFVKGEVFAYLLLQKGGSPCSPFLKGGQGGYYLPPEAEVF